MTILANPIHKADQWQISHKWYSKFLNQTDLLPLFQQVSLYFDNNDLQANIGNNSIEWICVNTTILVY